MEINNGYYLQILSSLNSHGVEYILVGGLAVGIHGYSRYTADMDLWINPTTGNISKLYRCLVSMGYDQEEVDQISKERNLESPTPIKLIDDNHLYKVDLMTNTFQKLYSFQECLSLCHRVESEGVTIQVVNIHHLIKIKENTKRLDDSMKDLVDAHELKKILKLQDKSKGKDKGF